VPRHALNAGAGDIVSRAGLEAVICQGLAEAPNLIDLALSYGRIVPCGALFGGQSRRC
jgi:hypothetical protein